MTTKILVGTDGSYRAAAAVSWAADVASELGVPLAVVHCVSFDWLTDGAATPGWEIEQAFFSRRLSTWCRSLSEAGIEHERIVLPGDPRAEIPGLADAIEADLIVVGFRGEGGFEDLNLGRVAHHLLHHASVPTAVVPGRCGPVAGGVVVVGVDGSPANGPALEWAMGLATRIAGSVEAVFVRDPVADNYPPPHSSNSTSPGRQQVEDLVASVTSDEGAIVRLHDRGGNVISELVGYADEVEAAMIVVGTRGHWSFGERLIGHVPSQLPSRSTVPVAIVPHRQHGADRGKPT